MENLLMWVIILAGALFGLVVTFLIASERELKGKSRRVEELESELANVPQTRSSAAQEEGHLAEKERQVVELRENNAQLHAEITELKNILETSQEKARQLESTQEQLSETERHSAELKEENTQLQTEVAELNQKLEASQEKARQLENTQEQLSKTERHSAELKEENTQGTSAATGHSTIEGAKGYLEAGKHREAIHDLETLLERNPDDQEARLLHLLASVQLYNIYGYEKQIESIKHLSNLSEAEKGIAKEIFLIRAEEAQSRGQDDEMLEYRNLATRVLLEQAPVEPAPEAKANEKTTEGEEGEHNIANPQDKITSGPTTQILAMAPGTESGSRLEDKDTGERKKAYAVFFGTILVFVLAGLVAARLWRDHPQEEVNLVADKVMTIPQTVHSTEEESEMSVPATVTRRIGANGDEHQEQPLAKQIKKPPKKVVSTLKKPAKSVTKIAAQPGTSSPVTPRAQSRPPKKTQDGGAASRLSWGQYKVIHPTPVYSKPSEQSQTVARISVGVKVNVVEVRGDWLEIRSKHGRPPGFIKKNSVMPTSNR